MVQDPKIIHVIKKLDVEKLDKPKLFLLSLNIKSQKHPIKLSIGWAIQNKKKEVLI